MTIYALLSRAFPNSFTAKIFFLAFLGTHVPLIVLATWILVRGGGQIGQQADVLALVLGATLLGTVATLAALQAILRPIFHIEAAMRSFEETGQVPPVPEIGRDELGRLMQRARRLMQRARDRIEATQRSADTDPLTGALNRRGFDRRVTGLGPGAVVHFDIDRFKSINDSLGHDAGDAVLRAAAQVAQRNLRAGDVFARFGGEEFVAFLPAADRDQAVAAAERIRAAVAAEVRAGDRPVTVSIGVALGSGAWSELLTTADAATYASKAAGRNRITVREVPDDPSLRAQPDRPEG